MNIVFQQISVYIKIQKTEKKEKLKDCVQYMRYTPYIFAYVPILSPYRNVQHLSKRKDDIFEDIALGNKNVYVKAAHHKLVNMASY